MLNVTIMSIMLNVSMLIVIYSECPNRMQYNDAQYHNKNCRLSNTILSIMLNLIMLTVAIMSIMLNVIMLSVLYSECPNPMQHVDSQHNNKTVIISVRIKPIVRLPLCCVSLCCVPLC
jgi:heme/copper-type cytochrome/quinol oxidase subunit 2